jgi:iron-sulfur cluster assembly protein
MITLTEAAAEKLGAAMKAKDLSETHALRVFVRGGGCGGMQYGMSFDKPGDNDKIYEQHGLRVIVDEVSLFYVDGASIDYVDSLMGGGFHIDNPQAVNSCSCSNSFRTAQTHTGEDAPATCYYR